MASDLPATSEVLLQTDASKHILDTFLGQGWDTWGTSPVGCGVSRRMGRLWIETSLVSLREWCLRVLMRHGICFPQAQDNTRRAPAVHKFAEGCGAPGSAFRVIQQCGEGRSGKTRRIGVGVQPVADAPLIFRDFHGQKRNPHAAKLPAGGAAGAYAHFGPGQKSRHVVHMAHYFQTGGSAAQRLPDGVRRHASRNNSQCPACQGRRGEPGNQGRQHGGGVSSPQTEKKSPSLADGKRRGLKLRPQKGVIQSQQLQTSPAVVAVFLGTGILVQQDVAIVGGQMMVVVDDKEGSGGFPDERLASRGEMISVKDDGAIAQRAGTGHLLQMLEERARIFLGGGHSPSRNR